MYEFFQIMFISNPMLLFIVSAIVIVFFIMIVINLTIFNNRIKPPYKKPITFIGFALSFGIMMYGMTFMFNGIIIPASKHMSECEVSNVLIRIADLGIETSRDITICRNRIDFESEEFAAYKMNTEPSNISLDRGRKVDRCITVEADLYVNHDELVAVDDTMTVQVCIKYGDLSYSKLQTAINGSPSK